MTLDFGGRRVGGGVPTGKIALGLGALVMLAAIAWIWSWQTRKAVAQAQAWAIAGPPCPAVSRPAYLAAGIPAATKFNFDDVGFARAFGHVDCDEITYGGGRGWGTYPACQFTSPGTLEITTPKGVFYFFPQIGPATVSVLHGVPRCVLGGRFKG